MIFQTEIVSLDFELEKLQALIKAKRQERERLETQDKQATNTLAQLAELVENLHDRPGLIASLKTKTMELFNSELTGQAYERSTPRACLIEDAPLSGQACQLCEPWDFDWELEDLNGQAWEIATPIACQLSDRPLHNPPEPAPQQCFELKPSNNNAISYFIKESGELGCVYIGGNNKARLKGWAYWLLREGYTQKIVCSRVAKRMTGWKHELKLKPMASDRIQELAAIYQENKHAPISDKPSKPPFVEPLHPIHKWQRGDKVVRLLTPSDTWQLTTEPGVDGKAFAVSLSDGRRDLIPIADCQLIESVFNDPTRQAISPKYSA